MAQRLADRRLLPNRDHPDRALDHELPCAGLDRVDVPGRRLTVLDRAVLARPTLDVARELLGAILVRDDGTGVRSARVVEVEAYIGEEDRASHARFGRTARNTVMFGPPGHAYVYLVYGMYDCLNVVTEPDGSPAALLVRAVEPLQGVELMRADRAHVDQRRRAARQPEARLATTERLARTPDARLASGPGLVAAAFGLDRSWTGVDLCDPTSPLRLERATGGPVPAWDIVSSARIGVGYAGPDWSARPWRFAVAGHPSVSGPRATR